MTEQVAKETVDQSFDEKAEAHFAELDRQAEETAGETTTPEKPEDTEPEETEEPGTDQQKPDSSEEDAEDVPKEFHKHPAWQRILKERDEARKTMEELKKPATLPEGLEERLAEFDKVTKSRSFIQSSMQEQGYTQDAINAKLRDAGYDVPTSKLDPYQLSLQALGVTEDQVPEENRAVIRDIGKIFDFLIDKKLGSVLPETLKPLEQTVQSIAQTRAADSLMDNIQKRVKEEGVLDYKKDIEPILNKWLDGNPKATQEDFERQFSEINHKLVLERMRTSGKRRETAEKKTALRDTGAAGRSPLSGVRVPEKTGDLDRDMDALLDAAGYRG